MPKPWTNDPILQNYRFCNVIRQDDKVSRWLMANWYKPYKNHKNMVIAVTIARLFNQPSTLERIGFPEHVNKTWLKLLVKDTKQFPRPLFNGAYIVSTNGLAMDKVEYVVERVLIPLCDNPSTIDDSSMQNTVELLQTYNGIGSFIAGQITADLRWALTGTWRDKRMWAPIGPGSKRGMNRLHGRPITAGISSKQWGLELSQLALAITGKIPAATYKRMEAIDLQNCLCEYDKFIRARSGEGRPKQRYQGV